jgi:hypothetical protein
VTGPILHCSSGVRKHLGSSSINIATSVGEQELPTTMAAGEDIEVSEGSSTRAGEGNNRRVANGRVDRIRPFVTVYICAFPFYLIVNDVYVCVLGPEHNGKNYRIIRLPLNTIYLY